MCNLNTNSQSHNVNDSKNSKREVLIPRQSARSLGRWGIPAKTRQVFNGGGGSQVDKHCQQKCQIAKKNPRWRLTGRCVFSMYHAIKFMQKQRKKTELLKKMLNKGIKKMKRFPLLSFEKYPQKIFNEDNRE